VPTAALRPILARDGIFNARDLGGMTTVDGRVVRSGRLVRADALHRARTSIDALRAHGVTRVLDLRDDREREDYGVFTADGIEVQHHPVLDPTFTWDEVPAVVPSELLAERYRVIIDEFSDRLVGAVAGIAEVMTAPDDAVAFHCAVGKDRTGLLAMLLLDTLGVPAEQIVADYVLSSRSTAVQVNWLWSMGRPEGVVDDETLSVGVWSARPATMTATIEWLHREHGGAADYLVASGLRPAAIDALRAGVLDG
jgi:protein-tyrosine phosphatase